MSGLEDRLSLDISDALTAVGRLEDAFVSAGTSAGQALQKSLEDAISSLNVGEVPIEADTTALTGEVDDAIAAADTQLELFAEADPITSSIDDAVAAADATVPVDADVSQAQDAISSLSGEEIEVGVAVDTGQAEEQLAGLGAAAHGAGEQAGHSGEQFALLGLAAKGAAGEGGALSELLHGIGPAGAAAAAGVAAVAIAGKELFQNALDARSAQQRFNLVLGEFGETVEHIDIGGLNENLGDFATRLGATGREVENAASKIFSIGDAAGAAGPEIAQTTKEILALAGRAVALNPALGNVGDVAERAFTGLARGGRFAANLGLALTSAEITARALADTGKTLSSELTIYEKSAAGAAIATERLGTSLSRDINEGAQNVQIRLQAIKARFEEAVEALGQPLIEPLLTAFDRAEPAMEALARVFAVILGPGTEIIALLADGLAPALEALLVPAQAVASALGVVADVVGAIPDPVKAAAVAAGLMALAVSKLATSTGLLASVAGTAGVTLGGLASVMGTLSLAAGAAVAVMVLLKQHTKEVNQDAQDLLVTPAQNALDAAANLKDVDTVIQQIKGGVNELNRAAAAKTGGPLGFFRQVDAADLKVGADALFQMEVNATRLTIRTRELQREFGLTEQQALAMARSGEEVGDRFNDATGAFEGTTDAVREQSDALERYSQQVAAGTFDQADFAQAIVDTGLDAETLAKKLDEARQPIIDLAGEVQSALPGVSSAFADMTEETGISLKTFEENARKNLEATVGFLGNINELISRGAVETARTLFEQSKSAPQQAAALAAEIAKQSTTALAATEQQFAGFKFGTGLVTTATTDIAEKLGGGLEEAADKARERFAARLEAMPGQLADTNKTAGEEVAQGTVNSIVESEAFLAWPDDMRTLGETGAQSFYLGIGTETERFNNQALAQKALDSVVNPILQAFDMHSPSKVMEDIGKDIIAGLFAGLSDVEGAADAVDPILDVMNKFKLNAADVAKASGDSIDAITESLRKLGEEQDQITPDELKAVGAAVKALGGSKGVKEFGDALAKQVSAAFGGLGGKEVADIVRQLNTAAAVQRGVDIFGVTPVLPKPFETNVVKGGDAGAMNIEQNITVTPPPEGTAAELAGLIAVASAWALQGVSA